MIRDPYPVKSASGTVCILGYFTNKYLANQRRAIGDKDYLNSKELYAPFRDIDIASLEDSNTGQRIIKAVELSPDTIKLLEKIDMAHFVQAQ
jgi:hypothetical protein